ncbi:MAG: hypothetical protein J5614_10245 [Paludibacteraceae bacterium]|nr:hypothetical protein [Paludibacteraceae bacterium]
MSDFHKSKEVYRYTPTANGDKLVPVRGLYVSGLHKEPWYIDHAVTVTKFESNEGTIVHYTSASTSFYDDSALAFTGLSVGGISVVNYYQDKTSVYDGSALAFTGVSIELPSMMSYTQLKANVYDDSALSFTGLTVQSSLTIVPKRKLDQPQNPQPIVTLTQFTSTAGSISVN